MNLKKGDKVRLTTEVGTIGLITKVYQKNTKARTRFDRPCVYAARWYHEGLDCGEFAYSRDECDALLAPVDDRLTMLVKRRMRKCK